MFNANKVIDSTTDVNFKALDKDKKVLAKRTDASCFAYFTYTPFDDLKRELGEEVRYVEFYFKDESTPYDSEFIEKYTKLMNELGFPVEYQGKKKDVHYIWFDIEKFNNKRIVMTSTFIIARYLLEDRLNVYPAAMFDLIDDGCEPFIALQKSHVRKFHGKYLKSPYGGNSNHAIRSCNPFEMYEDSDFFTKEEFWDKVAKSTITIDKDSKISTGTFWEK